MGVAGAELYAWQIANFLNNVFRSFYMQMGYMTLVMIDIALDCIV